ncbi:DUF1653 domain-containing protein [uncultured Duncaniella sp.]|uniref:DUF1653 domain-containing protein n=1 Tax=uncultured Duncaniella sp. TaxID=2768039 RepID=UPI0026298541|nr:DUF1653 domain-containing protein [uncultured Duncaniella sp.]
MNVQVGKKYQHFKGHIVRVVGFAQHTETNEKLVLYHCGNDDTLWARPESVFTEELDPAKYPEAEQTYRFEPYQSGPRTVNKSNPRNRKCEYCDHWKDGICSVSGEPKAYWCSARRCSTFIWKAGINYRGEDPKDSADTNK